MEARHRRWAAFANGRATGERGGHRGRRAEPNAGAGAPGVRPYRITRNTGRAQCARTPDPCNKVPPRANAVPSAAAESAPTRRDAHLRCIAERGRIGWQKASGYNWRALVECDISRWKRVIGDGLRSRADGRQATEVSIAADVLNRMLDLGRPEYVLI